jgi:uncharacterized membrane protein required for colicin V production
MKQFISTLNGLDIAFIVLITIGFIFGVRKGLAVMFSRTLALLGSMIAIFYYFKPVAAWVSENTSMPTKTTEVVLFIGIGIVAWGVLSLVFKIIGKFMEVKFSEGVSRVGGFILGGFWFYLFTGFVIYALLIFQVPAFKSQWVSESYAAPSAVKVSLMIREVIPHPAPETPEPTS